MSQIRDFQVTLTEEEELEVAEKSKITSLPEDGLLVLEIMEERVEHGLVAAETMLSGQKLLIAVAEKLEYEGDSPEVRAEIVDALKLMSQFATTRLVPIRIPEPVIQ